MTTQTQSTVKGIVKNAPSFLNSHQVIGISPYTCELGYNYKVLRAKNYSETDLICNLHNEYLALGGEETSKTIEVINRLSYNQQLREEADREIEETGCLCLEDVEFVAEINEKARKDFNRVILAIYHKLLSDPVVVEYLKKYEVQYKIESGKLWVEITRDIGVKEVEPYYVPLDQVHTKIDVTQHHFYLPWFVKNCEKVFYDAYHLDYNSDADHVSFLLDKLSKLG